MKAMNMMKGWMRIAVPKNRATSARISNGFSFILFDVVVVQSNFMNKVIGSKSYSMVLLSSVKGTELNWYNMSVLLSLMNNHI